MPSDAGTPPGFMLAEGGFKREEQAAAHPARMQLDND
jgi:hypothetical protein